MKLRRRIVSAEIGHRAAQVTVDVFERLADVAAARFIVPGDDEWPAGLDDLRHAESIQRRGGEPFGLWLRGPGHLAHLMERSVAIVGSRAATAYGNGIAADLAADLVEHGVTVAATVAVALTVLNQAGQTFNWYTVASHLLLALPCLGFGAYCARESSRHRELAQWARRIAVQLKSVGAYTARLDDAARLALLGQFGSYVFGPHQLGKDDNQVQPIPQELWKALADVIRLRGASS